VDSFQDNLHYASSRSHSIIQRNDVRNTKYFTSWIYFWTYQLILKLFSQLSFVFFKFVINYINFNIIKQKVGIISHVTNWLNSLLHVICYVNNLSINFAQLSSFTCSQNGVASHCLGVEHLLSSHAVMRCPYLSFKTTLMLENLYHFWWYWLWKTESNYLIAIFMYFEAVHLEVLVGLTVFYVSSESGYLTRLAIEVQIEY
jgi:hypothetical protein